MKQHDLTDATLRRVLGSFVTGVTVVTTIDRQRCPRGMTANSFASVSLDPPLVLVCIGQSAASHDEFYVADGFAINILSAEQEELSALFASKSPDKFENIAWWRGDSGSPVLDDVLAWIDCATHKKITMGDHLIMFGRVLGLGLSQGVPLSFFNGTYTNLNIDKEINMFPPPPLMVGGIVETKGRILLCRDEGGWTIPAECHRGIVSSGRNEFVQKCLALGFPIEPVFVYSIFTNSDGSLFTVYRCSVDADARIPPLDLADDMRLFDIDQLPHAKISTRPMRSMLQRYIHERECDRFGIYVESADGGQVGMLNGAPTPFAHYQKRSAQG